MADHEEGLSWQAQASPARQLRELTPVLVGAAGACALVLMVLLLFSLGESSRAGMWFSLKLTALMLGAIWALMLLGGGVRFALRGPLTLTYTLSGETLALEERTRRGRRRTGTLRLADVRRVRRRRDGLTLADTRMSMAVFCDAAQAARIEHALHSVHKHA